MRAASSLLNVPMLSSVRAPLLSSQGKPLQNSQTQNRECSSVGMAWGLCGFCYGPQINVARKLVSASWLVEALQGHKSFSDTISLTGMRSHYIHIARSEKGVQTGVTFLQYLKRLDMEISARSAAEVLAGNAPILRPVVLLVDNHSSRYDDEVLAAVGHAESEYGIRIFTEEPNTSQFLQVRSFPAYAHCCTHVLTHDSVCTHLRRSTSTTRSSTTTTRRRSARTRSRTRLATARKQRSTCLTSSPSSAAVLRSACLACGSRGATRSTS